MMFLAPCKYENDNIALQPLYRAQYDRNELIFDNLQQLA